MKYFYLLLTIVGVILPYTELIPYIIEFDSDMVYLFTRPFEEHATAFFAYDLFIAGTAAAAFIIHEGRKRQIKGWGWCIAGIFAVGVCFGLPLFLYLRERQLATETV
jgi:hypothetical protein